MKIVIDLECNSLINPTQIWLIVCRDIETNEYHIFREVTLNETVKSDFKSFCQGVERFIGHNWLGYDYPVIFSLLGRDYWPSTENDIDTLIISKLVDYPRKGHSIEDYGIEFKLPKGNFNDFKKYSLEMEEYCKRDVDICFKVYLKYLKVIEDTQWQPSIRLEHQFQLIVNSLSNNGFSFNSKKAEGILEKVNKELSILDEAILKEFLPKEVLIREFTPKATKHGTISKTSVPRSLWDKMHEYEVGKTYRHTKEEPFNPASHKKIIEVLDNAGWKPEEKTKTHIEVERELNRLKRDFKRSNRLDNNVEDVKLRYNKLKLTGYKINENNLNTLPPDAPSPARTLAKRILLEARRRTLTEWLGLIHPDTGRVHGKFQSIGTWTHRMASQKPNMQNIPNDLDLSGRKKLLGKELRSLWQAPRNRLLVGVDAEGIQLRIFAHYIDDQEFTRSIVEGKKRDKTDPHSFNQRILGRVCKSRAAAKRFIFSLLLGGGIGKLAEILECSIPEAQEALDRLMGKYHGFTVLKREALPKDGRRGWFNGLDGRKVIIPGDTASNRTHLALSGYLQNGEAVCMKLATLEWMANKRMQELLKEFPWLLVNLVHDEWQTEVVNNMEIAIEIANIQADSLRIVGERLGLKCPLAGSFWDDDKDDYNIGVDWSKTH